MEWEDESLNVPGLPTQTFGEGWKAQRTQMEFDTVISMISESWSISLNREKLWFKPIHRDLRKLTLPP